MRRSLFKLGITGILCVFAGCSARTPLLTTDFGTGGASTGGRTGFGGSAVRAVGGAISPDSGLGGGVGGGMVIGGATTTGGYSIIGGRSGTGGAFVRGGATVIGGAARSGGVPGTGGGPVGGAGGFCPDVTPCGGDVVGTWNVMSSCLNVSGLLDTGTIGLGCAYGVVTGTLKVSGTWTANGNGTFLDQTTTTGSEEISLSKECLTVSSVAVSCQAISGVLAGVAGYSSVSCKAGTYGGCICSATVAQKGSPGLVSPYADSTGSYKVSGSIITTDIGSTYSYCSSGNRMTWTPKTEYPVTTGTIVFQRGGATGSGGAGSGGRTGGAGGAGGRSSTDGPTAPASGPCDIYAADGAKCVAAHSTVRRLLSSYAGPLYQVRVGGSKSGTGGTLVDIGSLMDGFADGAAQDAACGDGACTISMIYDQSGLKNHLTHAPAGGAKKTAGNEADAKALPVTVAGHKLYGVHVTSGVGYRNNQVVGTATGDSPETIYMVASSDYYNGGCCFDYGNAETNNQDNGEGAAEAVYFGNCVIWGKGGGSGPWVMGDLENGLWAGDSSPYTANQSVPPDWKYVTGMVKGDAAGTNHWTIKVGNAQSGTLTTAFDGKRPSARYNPMRKEGAIILGIAGDNSNADQGNFFEGVMTAAYASQPADDAVQANIVAAYGQ